MKEQLISMEEFKQLADILPENASRRAVAKHMGLTLPLEMQLDDMRITEEKGRKVVSIPALELDDGSKISRKVLDFRVAREVAQRILKMCEAH